MTLTTDNGGLKGAFVPKISLNSTHRAESIAAAFFAFLGGGGPGVSFVKELMTNLVFLRSKLSFIGLPLAY